MFRLMRASSDIDCIFINAGVQGRYDLSKPESVDLAEFSKEIDLNFTSVVALTLAFLPFLQSKRSETSFI